MSSLLTKTRIRLTRLFSPQKVIESEMERITTELINQSIGAEGCITEKFKQAASMYDLDHNPIGEKKARELLVSMVKLAVAERSKLEGRIIESAEQGMLYSNYTTDLANIAREATEIDALYSDAESAREDYLIAYGNYQRNRLESYHVNHRAGLPDDDLAELNRRIEKIDRITGLGGDK